VNHPRSDRGLEFAGGAFGDDLTVVYDSDPVGELIGLVEVLRGEQYRSAFGGEGSDDVPDLVAAARVEAGGRLVEEDQIRRDDDAGRDVERAPHAPRVFLDLTARRIGQSEGFKQLSRTFPGRFP
jgi:hypothetical protein